MEIILGKDYNKYAVTSNKAREVLSLSSTLMGM